MSRKKRNSSWLTRQSKDPYVAKSKQSGYRSRASFKILELNQSDKLFKPGMCVVDLGAAPGGWSQVLAPILGRKGRMLAVDLLEMPPLAGVEFIQGDFTESLIQQQMTDLIGEQSVDWVISDMAPNLSGIMSVDQPRIMTLAEEAWAFAERTLPPGGGFLVKVFQGAEIAAYIQNLKRHFKSVVIRKPDASRSASREIYVVAKQLIGG